ncbi:MAG: ethylmalonic encephalopathy 1 [Monoraphidium minutum]|nr:MAG: ethylmalonic encephalopathy 1 [Monoraphidium minutum]
MPSCRVFTQQTVVRRVASSRVLRAGARMAPPAPKLVFRQLFDSESSTYTYIIGDAESREAAIIDPVKEKVDRDLSMVKEMGLELVLAADTHAHADHVTAVGAIKDRLPRVKTAIGAGAGAGCADAELKEGEAVRVGGLEIQVLATPGHTAGCVSYYLPAHGLVFTGDALLVRGCGRTDFQHGDSSRLYDSVHSRLFSLPDDTIVYPAHDYQGRTASTIGEEKAFNPRLSKGKAEFIEIMGGLGLPYPKRMDAAVPANLRCGREGKDGADAPARADEPGKE